MISKAEIESELDGGEVTSVENEGEHSARVKTMVSCRNGCSGCPHGPYAYQVERRGDALEWSYLGPIAGDVRT